MRTHTNFSDPKNCYKSALKLTVPNTYTKILLFSRRSPQDIFQMHTEQRISFLSGTKYILFPLNKIFANSLNTQGTKEYLRVTNFEVMNFSVFRRICRKWRTSLRQENSEGGFGKKEGRRKEERNWLAILVAMVLRYRSTSYDLFRCSRRDCHCVCITPRLSRVIGAFGPGVCTLAVCRTRD